MHVSEIHEIFEFVLKKPNLIVDVGGISTYDFLEGLANYKGMANDFDRFVIPVNSSYYFHEKAIYTIRSLLELGVRKKNIKIIFNMHRSYENNIRKAFFLTTSELNKLDILFDYSIVIPKSEAYFSKLNISSEKPYNSREVYETYYPLQKDGTNGNILHRRARDSLSDCFFRINNYIYE
jgi:hypothetical protein